VNLLLSISAENDRAKRAEKRRIYADYMAGLIGVIFEASYLQEYGSAMTPENHRAKEVELTSAIARVVGTLSEVALIASPELAMQVEDVGRNISNAANLIADGKDIDLDFYAIRLKLYEDTRADLSEAA
jgi:hypothetical protein